MELRYGDAEDVDEVEDFQPEIGLPHSALVGISWVSKCICALEIFFTSGEEPQYFGTGFLIRLPDWYKQGVIMTAGHNLINKSGIYAKKINVIFDGAETIVVYSDKGQYFASKSYEKTPNPTNRVNDYGCIRIERQDYEKNDAGGFAYSLLPDKGELIGKEATVYGYPSPEPNEIREAQNAKGSISAVTSGQLRYQVSTLPGHSGGPVCIDKNGPCVIGIHNYGRKDGNHGTLLTCDILFEILDGLHDIKSLGAKGTDIFLKIPPGSGAGVLARRGKDRYTKFAFVPVEVHWKKLKLKLATKYIMATPHLKPPTYLTFRKPENTSSPGSITTTRDLVDNRPKEENVVVLEHLPSNPPSIKISAFQEKYILRIPGEQFNKPVDPEYPCGCTVFETGDIDLVCSSITEAKCDTKFFLD